MKLKLILSTMLCFFSLAWITSCTLSAQQQLSASELTTGVITEQKIDEASGIAISQINTDIIWVNNDSGNKAALYALNSGGELVAKLTIKGVKNNDWEDLATFAYQGENYILIADVGDNYTKRDNYQLHFIKEPHLNNHRDTVEVLKVKPTWSMTFSYQDHPRDCEAVAVDLINQQILLLSKREFPPQLFTLPLPTSPQPQTMIAQKLGTIAPLPSPAQSRFGIIDIMNYSNMPTAMDISADNTMAVILTYSAAYLYAKKPQENWLQAFSQTPRQLDFPLLKQGEAIGFNQSAKSLYITSEKIPAPILKIDINESSLTSKVITSK